MLIVGERLLLALNLALHKAQVRRDRRNGRERVEAVCRKLFSCNQRSAFSPCQRYSPVVVSPLTPGAKDREQTHAVAEASFAPDAYHAPIVHKAAGGEGR
jgi:hypothetical protein